MITINVTELFTPEQLETLKAKYAVLNSMSVEVGGEYDKLAALLDSMTLSQLDQLSKAGVKFVSPLALNRVNRRTKQ